MAKPRLTTVFFTYAECLEIFKEVNLEMIKDQTSLDEIVAYTKSYEKSAADKNQVIDFIDDCKCLISIVAKEKRGIPDRIMIEVVPHDDVNIGEYRCVFNREVEVDMEEWEEADRMQRKLVELRKERGN